MHYMRNSDEVRIQYAHKYRRVSNAWKKWQGMILGLERNKVVEQKMEEESAFQLWVNQDGERIMKYGELLERISGSSTVIWMPIPSQWICTTNQ